MRRCISSASSVSLCESLLAASANFSVCVRVSLLQWCEALRVPRLCDDDMLRRHLAQPGPVHRAAFSLLLSMQHPPQHILYMQLLQADATTADKNKCRTALIHTASLSVLDDAETQLMVSENEAEATYTGKQYTAALEALNDAGCSLEQLRQRCGEGAAASHELRRRR